MHRRTASGGWSGRWGARPRAPAARASRHPGGVPPGLCRVAPVPVGDGWPTAVPAAPWGIPAATPRGEVGAVCQPVAACGWRGPDGASWLTYAPLDGSPFQDVVGRPLPKVPPGQVVRRDLRGGSLHIIGVGHDHVIGLLFGSRGYHPPLAQRAVFRSLCEGRFRVARADRLPPIPARGQRVLAAALVGKGDIADARRALQGVLAARGAADQEAMRVAVAVTEAMINAVRYGGGGALDVVAAGSRLYARVDDRGPGIAFDRLARVLLAPRDAAAVGRGHGFWLMLTYAQRCHVLTGSGGTRVLLVFEVPAGPGAAAAEAVRAAAPAADP